MTRPPLEPDYSLEEVADALGMSTRWVRDRIRLDNAEHTRYGHRIRFTAEQVAKLRAAHVRNLVPDPVTSGPKRRRSA